jgi:hypothetical protein
MVREEYSKVLGTKSVACGLRSSDTSNLVSWLKVSLSLRLSQHHHNKQPSTWSWGGGKVCRDNRSGRIFYRRQSQDGSDEKNGKQ